MDPQVDEDVLQDFLIEAGELLEQLNEQLICLERNPRNSDLLNAVFRGFHTIKGGAGFLGIGHLVEVCHRSEDVFNALRQGQRQLDAALMDVILQALDTVKGMFSQVQSGMAPEPAPAGLLSALQNLASVTSDDSSALGHEDRSADRTTTVRDACEGLEEGEKRADSLGAQACFDTLKPQCQEQITDLEFEALLDELHGKGQFNGVPGHDREDAALGLGDPHQNDAKEQVNDAECDRLRDESLSQEAVVAEPAPRSMPEGKTVLEAAPPDCAPAQACYNSSNRQRLEPGAGKAPPTAGKAGTVDNTVRVDTERLDSIMNMVGELVLVRNRLSTLKDSLDNEEMAAAVTHLDVVTADLQLAVMKARMQPIRKVFGRFPRLVRDLSRSLHKEIELELLGEETDLDKNLVEALAEPLIHLVRNSVDHGIESPEQRERNGKPRVGKVLLSAAQEGDHILLSIADDGKGLNADRLREKAVENCIMDVESASRLDEKECYELIFAPGFSTRNEVSDVSGRGVGMDVVKTRIAQMNGSVEIHATPGKGCTIKIKVPLTMAILPTLMVKVGEQPFALPLVSVVEIFNLEENSTNVVDRQLMVRVRDDALPLFYLRQWLNQGLDSLSPENSALGHVVIVKVGHTRVGLVVDDLIGQEEVVIKPLGALLQGLAGMAGATITGDGRIALILDLPGLMEKYARR